MDILVPLATLAVVHLLAVMSPGPSFLVVSRTALERGRSAALAASLGMTLGVIPWAVGAMYGLALLFERAVWLYTTLKAAGGLYLLYLAIQVWRHADTMPSAEAGPAPSSLAVAFREAFLIQIANPKVAVFFASIFVAVLPPALPVWLSAVVLAIVLANEFLWYALVALLFSAQSPRAAYLRVKPVIDRVMAVMLGALGLRLLWEARP
jgi:RhtB (resistance to homoserine/threonine) family protein